MVRRWVLGGVCGAATIVAVACGDNGESSLFAPSGAGEGGIGETPQPPSFGDKTEGGAPDATPADSSIDCDANPGGCVPAAVCGDGKAGLGESCDDGNKAPGDGCSATCQIEAPYWACSFGSLCVDVRDCAAIADAGGDGGCVIPPKAAVCGDGFIDPGEACDDGNAAGNDGCALDCKAVEANFVCPTPGAKCVSTMVCGDGVLQGTEQCDDHNVKSADGCSSTCQLEAGWVCPLPGTACSAAKCGDGLVAGSEECDDKNTANNDGCSATCRLQTTTTTVAPTATAPGKTTIVNWACPTPGVACVKTTCGTGSGVREGTEQCDDGNNKALDGCSPDCQWEPSCPNGTCASRCGDGLLFDFDADGIGGIDEECDDGNLRNGDGCSSTCKKEAGYSCVTAVDPDPAFLDVPVVLRDFTYSGAGGGTPHPDFNAYACNEVTEDLVMGTLTNGRPVYRYDGTGNNPVTGTDPNGLCGGGPADKSQQLTSALDFAEWYAEPVGARAKRIDDTMIRLTRTGAVGDYSYVFDSDVDQPYVSRGGFFPLDGKGWGDEGQDANSKTHNFAFTTEVRFWFTYDAGKSPQLTFSGDDDVWVFVNGKLALDLGGLHSRLQSSFTLDAAKATSLGLVDNHVYEIALFHAERHTNASNFKLTLRGFVKKRSVCTEICGDGIHTPSEQCDDGAANTNSGAYGSCRTDCKLGPYCGDKTKTSPPEDCDDGVNLTSWAPSVSSACGPSCKSPAYCGDGIVQGTFGEVCDNTTANNTGGYGQCKSDCTLGPRCGDAIVQATSGEGCDNGFNLTAYVKHPTATDCAPGCVKPRACGDGVVDFPVEACDNGAANTNDGSYNACTSECVFGARCGDGVKNGPEECDDSNRANGDGCSAACLIEGSGPH